MSMELIDRDRAIRIAEQGQVKGFEWQYKQLVTEPTVKVVSIERLEQIKAEIEDLEPTYNFEGFYECQSEVIKIIDKVIKEAADGKDR